MNDSFRVEDAQNSITRTRENNNILLIKAWLFRKRTNGQQEEGKAMVLYMVNEVSALVCFTDGSCLPNPGPCGAGAVIYQPDGQEE